MEFVINRRTFNTATSTTVAISRGIRLPNCGNVLGDSELRYENVLYRTATGIFFVHEHNTVKFVKGGLPLMTDQAREFTPEEAAEWIEDNRATVICDELKELGDWKSRVMVEPLR